MLTPSKADRSKTNSAALSRLSGLESIVRTLPMLPPVPPRRAPRVQGAFLGGSGRDVVSNWRTMPFYVTLETLLGLLDRFHRRKPRPSASREALAFRTPAAGARGACPAKSSARR